jgi:hypothetical protein
MGLEVLAVAGLIASVAGTAASIEEGKTTQRRQKKQAENVSATNSAKATAAKRQEFRAERVRRAQLTAQAEASGASGSSTAIAGEGLSGTLAAQKVGSISSALDNTNVISAGSQAIADSQARKNLFGNVASIGSSVFSSAGGFSAFDTPK